MTTQATQAIETMYEMQEQLPLVDYGFGEVEQIQPLSQDDLEWIRKQRQKVDDCEFISDDMPSGHAFGEYTY